MKSLSLSKPLVLVMLGLPGAGKSFFARQFSETFGSPVVSYDRLRHVLYADGGWSKEEQTIIRKLAAIQLEGLFRTQKTFIMDGAGVSRTERLELRKLARSVGYDTLLIWVQTDPTTAQYRAMKRSSRHTYDQYNPSLSSDVYTQLARRFSPPLANEECVVISGKHTYATQARVVLKKLVVGRETVVNNRAMISQETRSQASQPARGHTLPGHRDVLVR